MSTAITLALGITGEELRQAIYGTLGEIVPTEAALDHSYARLGSLLAAFKSGEYWRGLGYANFDAFMLELRETYNRGRSQLYAYCSVAERLLPMVSADTLDQMGISKAQEVKRAICGGPGRKITEEVLAAALNPKVTIKELRAVLHAAYNITDDNRPTGQWFDFGGAYLTADEKELFVGAVKVGMHILNIKPETPDWIQRKEVLMAMAGEFYGTHAAEVFGPDIPEEEHGA